MVAAPDLVHGVRQDPREDREAVADAPVEPGRFTIRVWPATPARPRDRAAVGTVARPSARMACGMPGIS